MFTEQVKYGNLASNDIRKTAEFLHKVFGWEIQLGALNGERSIQLDENASGFNGGVFTVKDGKPYYMTIYIIVEDIHTVAKTIERLGGVIIEPPFQKNDGTQVCFFSEPSGNTHSLIQPTKLPGKN